MGYHDDNDFIPGSRWRVHDAKRPLPRVVQPAAFGSKAPPSDAVVLFDGTSTKAFESVKQPGADCPWTCDGDELCVVPKTGNIRTREAWGDIQLHLEWQAPSEIRGEDQGRGNSGVFLMGLYEIQVLDNYENPTYADGYAGAMYGQQPPLVNACCPPGAWHSYDVLWQAPRFSAGSLLSPARISVIHNGVAVQVHRELQGPTQHKVFAGYVEHPATGPLMLQDHNDLVRFRNIWLRPL